jgi:predicted RNase H-like HicB family nuclease
MVLKVDTAKQWLVQFDDLAEMTHWLDTTPAQWSVRSSLRQGNSFAGASYEDAVRMAREGWEEGVGRVSALVDSLPTGSRAVTRYDVAGEYPDVARYIAGDPFNMVRRGTSHRQRPVMTIVVGCCCSGATPTNAMENYAAAMVALIDRLENRGVSVELIGNATSRLGGRRVAVTWGIKRQGQALDLNAVAFGAGHPAMLRRLTFAAWERSHASWACSSYGQVEDPIADDVLNIPSDSLIIAGVGVGNGSHCRTLKDAVRFAEEQINSACAKLGVEPIASLEELEA